MRSHRILLGLTVLIVCSTAIAFWGKDTSTVPSSNTQPTRFPAPTELQDHDMIGEKADHRQRREAWLDQKHKVKDWRERNDRLRHAKRIERNTQRQQLWEKGQWKQGKRSLEVLADSNLTGTWAERGSYNIAGRMHTCDIDWQTNTIYAGSSGKNLWKGSFSGGNWTCMNDQFANEVNFVRYIDTIGRLMMAGGKYFLYSDNQGITWDTATGLENVREWGSIERTVISGGNVQLIYLISLEWDWVDWGPVTNLHRSFDWGTSFQKVRSFRGWPDGKDIWTSRYGITGQVFVFNVDSLFKVDHQSNNLTFLSTMDTANRVLLTGCEVGAVSHLYCFRDDTIYQSHDSGLSWQFAGEAPLGPFGRGSFTTSSFNADLLFIGGVNVFRSTDRGATWDLVNEWWEYYGEEATKLHADIPAIDVIRDKNNQEWVMVSTDGGLYRSGDQLLTVENLSLASLGVGQYYSSYTYRNDASVVYLGSQDQGFQRCTQDSGGILSFVQTISGDYGSITSGDEGLSLWTVYPGFAMYYPNATTTLDAQFWDFIGGGWEWMAPLMEDPNNPNNIFVGGGDTIDGQYLYFLESNGGGITHTKQAFDFSLNNTARITALAVSPISGDNRYLLTSEGRFFRSSDGGANWNLSGFDDPNLRGNDIEPSRIQSGKLFICGSGYDNPGVYFSIDHGSTFFAMDNGLPATSINDLALNANETLLFAATDIGPYVYIFDTGQWYDIMGLGAPDQDYRAVDYVPTINTMRFSTYGRGLWDFAISCDVPDPVYLNEVTTTSADLSWNSLLGINGYVIQYKKKTSQQWSTLNTNSPNISLTNLLPNTDYELRARGKGCGYFSEVVEFKTLADPSGMAAWTSEIAISTYPNPFIQDLYVEYTLPQAATVTITIYNLNGKMVKQLLHQPQNPGTLRHHFTQAQLPNSPGAYLLQVSLNGQKAKTYKLIKL